MADKSAGAGAARRRKQGLLRVFAGRTLLRCAGSLRSLAQDLAAPTLTRCGHHVPDDPDPRYLADVANDHARQAALLRAVTESSADAVLVIDPQGLVTYANPEAERMFGWPRDQLVGRALHTFIHEPRSYAGAALHAALMRVAGSERAAVRDEEVFARRDGTRMTVESHYAPVVIGGDPAGAVLTVRDITARSRLEAEARENGVRLSDLLGTLDLAKILVLDPDDTIRFWSRGCENLYGWTVAEAVGQASSELLRTASSAPLMEIDAILLRDGEWSGDLTQTCRDGSCIVVAVRKVLQRGADGAPRAIMESVVDVTLLRGAEAGLHQLNRELEQRVTQEVASREAAQVRAAHAERMQALGQLAGGIAHDFNNILQVVSGSAALIERRQGDPVAINRFVRRIIDSANRGATITRRMLVFARRGTLEAEPAEPAAVLEGLREICAYTLGPGIEIRVDCAADLPRLFADKGQLETALVNLATNARDAMADGGILTLSAAAEAVMPGDYHPAVLKPGRYIGIAVSDTGAGMDSVVLGRVTEPFFTTKGIGEGTGLGLSMVKGFAEQSGGGVSVVSEPGVGTVASLWLPQADYAEAAGGEAVGQEVTSGAGARVLLVDDDHLVRETLAAQLEAEGYVVLSASGGEDALSLLEGLTPIDILVTDLAMPRMSGHALIQQAQRLRSRLPAFLLTGCAEDAATVMAGGADGACFDLMHKPVSGAQLARRIAEVLQPATRTDDARTEVTLGA